MVSCPAVQRMFWWLESPLPGGVEVVVVGAEVLGETARLACRKRYKMMYVLIN